MFTVPAVVLPEVNVTVPADTVARAVLLEFQVATEVTSNDPLQVSASAVMGPNVGTLVVTAPLVGFNVILVTQPTVTVTVAVAVMVEFWLDVAVTVAVPILLEVTRPELEIVATGPPLVSVPLIVQVTAGWLVMLLSLLIPVAFICTVLSVVPVSSVHVDGAIEREVKVGF